VLTITNGDFNLLLLQNWSKRYFMKFISHQAGVEEENKLNDAEDYESWRKESASK
jgi:hypothetical protein